MVRRRSGIIIRRSGKWMSAESGVRNWAEEGAGELLG